VKQTDLITRYLKALKETDFKGDIEASYGARVVASTDNSVYQVLPQAIIYPKIADDINQVVALINSHAFIHSGLSITMRGGGTGTNGQSLNESVILDTSRYLNNILSFDKEAATVTVEPGVVLDQLNAYLAEHKLFFPPDVSSSSRATLGGMVATDASGKGSCVYGKTSDYIEQLDVVLSDGSDFSVKPVSFNALSNTTNRFAQQFQQKIVELLTNKRDEIDKVFPRMNRGLTGYNLKQSISNDSLNLAYLLAGSEGTLALSKKITLKVISKPKHQALVVVLYKDFDKTLEHVQSLLEANPTAIEVLDDKILQIVQQDPIWQEVQNAFKAIDLDADIKGLNFIEVSAEHLDELKQGYQLLQKIINQTGDQFQVMGSLVETNTDVIKSLWNIRKRAVGLLGALKGERQPTAFVEDTAVPPQNLPAYIKEFRSILDNYGLDYGMYGHADVGCLHVRPALNMRNPKDQRYIRAVTDQVAQLSKRYGGLLWGEHGRGYRGEYSPLFFGEVLTPLLSDIKSVFDPHNLFNPGKLAVPTDSKQSVTAIDKVPFRGGFDSQITNKSESVYNSALRCNGNGACFSWDKSEAMCPSYKVTRNKRLSPKGRAAMLREWLRLSATTDSYNKLLETLEKELFESLDSCLSCKSCTHSCPIKVDIPELKSHFLASFYLKRKRPVADYLFASFENIAALGRKFPALSNRLIRMSDTLLANTMGIIRTPEFTPSLARELNQRGTTFLNLTSKIAVDHDNTVILLPDTFNASYATQVLIASYDVLTALGYQVLVAPVLQNGKALHVKGFRNSFAKIAANHVLHMQKLAELKVPLISTEIVTRLMHHKEYQDVLQQQLDYKVWSLESWLESTIQTRPEIRELLTRLLDKQENMGVFTLLPHCMEQTADKQSVRQWQAIFSALGLDLKSNDTGCCGMSGLFGHEKQNKPLSDSLFSLNWHQQLTDNEQILVTGFSCRCQCKTHGFKVKHPIEILFQLLC